MGIEWTPERYKRFVISLIRSGMRRYPPKYEALKKAYVGIKINQNTGRKAKHYRCNKCKGTFPQKEVNTDHIEPVVDPDVGFVDWNTYIARMFCDENNFQILCIPCHKTKTIEERKKK